MGYGYEKRGEMPDRFIPSTPQAAPRSQMPRRVNEAIKNPGDTGTLSQIQGVFQSDALPMFGLTPSSTTEGGAGSATVSTDTWWSDIGRFCRYVEVNASGAAGNKRINRTQILLNISPLAMLDPAKGAAPWIWRFEDVCAARLSSPGASHVGAFYFGQTWENGIGGALAAPLPFIGIYAKWTGTAYGTWTARCVSDAGVGLDASLGITTEHPHRLMYAMDGRGQVLFYIDGELLYTYDTLGTDLGTHTSFQTSHRWCAAADAGGTIKAGYMIDMQAVEGVEVLDEAA